MNAYTYLIGWTEHGKFYYGAQWNKNADPSALWKTYFTSSAAVKKFRETYGVPDVIEIRKEFGSNAVTCRSWEERVLKRVRKFNSGKWLNRSAGSSKWFSPSGMVYAINTKTGTGVYVSTAEYSANGDLVHILTGRNNVMKDSTIKKMSDAKIGKRLSEHHCNRISESLKGRTVIHSSETCSKISNKLKGTVAVVNMLTGERYRVSGEEFKSNPNLKGTRYKLPDGN